jgi:hypothetical protein
MECEPYNFIVAKLCDNDFGHHIKDALVEGVEWWGLDKKACPIIWKRFIIAYLMGYLRKRHVVYSENVTEEHMDFLDNNYFQGIRVTFERNAPTEDHDGGSAAYDINRKYAWTF